MNICLLNDSFPPVIDGVVNVMMNYADYLMREHQSAIIVGTPRYPGADYRQYAYPVIAYPSLDTAAVTNGYRTGNPFAAKALEELPSYSLITPSTISTLNAMSVSGWRHGKPLPPWWETSRPATRYGRSAGGQERACGHWAFRAIIG